MKRFVKRTWRRTSEKVCRANAIPPGFRIVLLDEAGRVKRDDLLVRSGDFGFEPGDFTVERFLRVVMDNCVKDAGALGYDGVALRDHRDEQVDPYRRVRRVREMCGAGGKRAQSQWEPDDEDAILQLESEIDEALSLVEESVLMMRGTDDYLLLKSVFAHIISRFDIDVLDDVYEFYERDIERKRSETD